MVVIEIDAQREYVDGALPLEGIERALDHIAHLLAAARPAGAPVIHVAHRGRAGGMFDADYGGTSIEWVRPAAGEATVFKTLPNALAQTDLLTHVERFSRAPLLLCGFMTHMCARATARAALDTALQ